MLTKRKQYGYRRRPGLFPTYGSAIARVSAWLLLSFCLISLAIVVISAICNHPNAAMRTFCGAGFVLGAVAFANLGKSERNRGGKLFAWFLALDLLVLAANCAGVLP